MMSQQRNKLSTSRRGGFTLVEMLISVALVLLMMTMFANIFSIATQTVQTQQANGESDQKARTLSTILRGDVSKRTTRVVQPFFPGENNADSPISFADRGGYFYVSTNTINSGLDDILQFTVHANQTVENPDGTLYFGRSRQLRTRTGATSSVSGTLANNPNQPEVDDGVLSPNQASSSPAAQISYFLRNGDLYRRVVLLREPLRVGGQILDPQARNGAGLDFFSGHQVTGDPMSTFDGRFAVSGVTPAESDDFATHFDFSAIASPPDGAGNRVANFLGVESLSNDITGSGRFSLGIPHFRWGFDQFTGLSHEHLNSNAGSKFLGRYTHAETSSPNFNWPQRFSTIEGSSTVLWSDTNFIVNGNPMATVPVATHAFNFNGAGLVSDFDASTTVGRGGTRRVEDLLMANVHEFRVELWDERLGDYVTPGYTGATTGDFHIARRMTTQAGPGGANVRRAFDTWHPGLTAPNIPNAPAYAHPLPNIYDSQWAPFHPHQFTPPNVAAGGPTPNGLTPSSPDHPTFINEGFYDATRTDYAVGDVVFGFRDNGGPGGIGTPTNDVFDFNSTSIDELTPAGFERAFRCIRIADTTGGPNPVAGALIGNPSSTIGQKITDGNVQWIVMDNARPLRSIRVTIRFLNQRSNSLRQVTLVMPLTDDT